MHVGALCIRWYCGVGLEQLPLCAVWAPLLLSTFYGCKTHLLLAKVG